MSKHNNDRPCVTSGASAAEPGEEYKVGPGRPPREHRFKPGQKGNPKGAKRKAPSPAPDLKQLLERALGKTVTLKQGERQQIVTMASAGIEHWSPSSPKAIVMAGATSSGWLTSSGLIWWMAGAKPLRKHSRQTIR